MAKPVNIFLVGATGYIGGAVLTTLLEEKSSPAFPRNNVTALTRSDEQAQKLRFLVVEAVVGSLDDVDTLREVERKSDVVIECAGVIADNAGGMYGTEFVYYDSDADQRILETQPHRDVDLNVVAGDKKGIDTSQQIPGLIRASMDLKLAGMVGEGKNFHPNVHIDDLEHIMRDIAEAMGEALEQLGLTDSFTPSTFTKTELAKYFRRSDNLGTNVRCRGERSRAVGWKPRRITPPKILASIKPEIQNMLAERD
ncbi:hypothetical protein C8Q80DRAFT_1218633 [Daedaleopsis nitida]|nr:hypothetical protein C8Q80DRAFT_1218633 [Daedaleopsis nitida]